MEKLLPNHDEILESAPRDDLQLENPISRPWKGEHSDMGRAHKSNNHNRYEFSFFDGMNPCSSLRKGESYFHYNNIFDPESWWLQLSTWLVRLSLGFSPITLVKAQLNGIKFTEEIYKRFKGASNSKFNLVEEYKKVEQKGTVDKYLEKFKDLKTWILIRNPTIPERFFLRILCGMTERIN